MKKFFYLLIFICGLLLSSCSSSSIDEPMLNTNQGSESDQGGLFGTQSLDMPGKTSPAATSTPTPEPTQTVTLAPSLTLTLTSTPTVTPTAPDLVSFDYSDLHQGVQPVAYIEDPCDYLISRWHEDKSAPGTIVVPIMFHSVAKPGREITDSTTISVEYLDYFMERAKTLGFSTITTEELIGFLNRNEKIPERSMILILDDRRPGVVEEYFMPYLEANDWTLTLAWPTTDATNDELWERMETLSETGYLDIQSHGHDHIYIQDYTPFEEIYEEVYQPIEVIESHFGTTPRALIWPGGNFNQTSVQLAQEAGFKLGFTVFSRGPVMYNWIPLGSEESAMEAPLLVLPRFWSTAADAALDKALKIGEEARVAAEALKAEELAYIALYCQPQDGD
jgi:peptidoglycan/xylan/chitin deacetylase (PgdA/CDA1 family)